MLLTPNDAAARLNTSPRHIRDLIRRQGLPVVRVGRLLRIPASDLEAWIESNREVRS